MIDPAQPEVMRAAAVDVATYGTLLAVILGGVKVVLGSKGPTEEK